VKPNEITPYGGNGLVPPTTTRREISRVVAATRVQQAVIHAKTTVGAVALSEVAHLKAVQRQLEYPDSADALALIVNTTIQGIARSVADFTMGF
jgi:hypothetical protein